MPLHNAFMPNMRGKHIKDNYDDIYSIAMFSYDGRHMEFQSTEDGGREFVENDVSEVVEGDFEYFFYETGKEMLFLDWH